MNITCPSCGCNGSLDLFVADREFREAIVKAAELPSNCGALVLRYVGLFRPGKRQLTASRAAKLIGEVLELIQAEEVKLGKQTEKVLAHTWQKALQIVLDNDKLTRPLKNHNYLIKIALNMVNQYEALPDADEDPVVVRNSTTGGSMKSVAEIVDEEESQKALKRLRELTADEHNKLMDRATKQLLDEGIPEDLIIAPMIEGMMLSILRGKS